MRDETEKPTRGQGGNWKISSSWMSLSSLAWRDSGKEEVGFQSPEAGVISNPQVDSVRPICPGVRNTQCLPFSCLSVICKCLPLAKQTQLSVRHEETSCPIVQDRGSGRNGTEVIQARTVL